MELSNENKMIGGRKGSSNENKAELFGNCKGHERGVRKQRLGAPVDRTLVCVSPSMNTKSRSRPLFRCCESEPGILGDPHLGPVCSDCYARLTAARAMLEKIGPLVGIGPCSSEVSR